MQTHLLQYTVCVEADEMTGTSQQSAEIIGDMIYQALSEILPHDFTCEVSSYYVKEGE